MIALVLVIIIYQIISLGIMLAVGMFSDEEWLTALLMGIFWPVVGIMFLYCCLEDRWRARYKKKRENDRAY